MVKRMVRRMDMCMAIGSEKIVEDILSTLQFIVYRAAVDHALFL